MKKIQCGRFILLSLGLLVSACSGGDEEGTKPAAPVIENQSADANFGKFESFAFATNQHGDDIVTALIGSTEVEFQKTHFDSESGFSEYVGMIPDLPPGEQLVQVTVGNQALSLPINIVETNYGGKTEREFIEDVITRVINDIDAHLSQGPSAGFEALRRQISEIDLDTYNANQLSFFASVLANNSTNLPANVSKPKLKSSSVPSKSAADCFKPAGSGSSSVFDTIISTRANDQLGEDILKVSGDSLSTLQGMSLVGSVNAAFEYAQNVVDCFQRAEDPVLEPIGDIHFDDDVLVLEAEASSQFNTARLKKYLEKARNNARRNVQFIKGKIALLQAQAESELKPMYAEVATQLQVLLDDIQEEIVEYYNSADFDFDLESQSVSLNPTRNGTAVTFSPEMHVTQEQLNTTLTVIDNTDNAVARIPVRFVQNLPVACPSSRGSFRCGFAPDAFQVVIGRTLEGQVHGEEHDGFRIAQQPEKGTVTINEETGEFSYTVNPDIKTNTYDSFEFVTYNISAESLPVTVEIGIAAARYGLVRRRVSSYPEFQKTDEFEFGDRMVQVDLEKLEYGLVDLDTGERFTVAQNGAYCDGGGIWTHSMLLDAGPNSDYLGPHFSVNYAGGTRDLREEDQFFKNFPIQIYDCDHQSYVAFRLDVVHKRDALRFMQAHRIETTIRGKDGSRTVEVWSPDLAFTRKRFSSDGVLLDTLDASYNFTGTHGAVNCGSGDAPYVEGPIVAEIYTASQNRLDLYFKEDGELVTSCLNRDSVTTTVERVN